MPLTPIRAVDEIVIPASAERIWSVVSHLEGYPRWWPASLRVRVDSGRQEVEIRPRGSRSFSCRVEASDPPSALRVRYGGGFIEGTGEWRIEAAGGGCRVTYRVDVAARGWLVAILARVMDLAHRHSREMKEVLANLRATVLGEDQAGTCLAGGASGAP